MRRSPNRGETTSLAGEALREPVDETARHQALFQRVIGRIYAYFRRMVFDAHEAEDCVQETLLVLERSLREGTYDPERSFNTWMWLKAHTVFCAWCRKRKRRVEAAAGRSAQEPAIAAATGGVAERLDKDAILRRVEEELGTEAFEAFVLYYHGDLSHAEVGELLGRHRTTVAERIRAAHRVIDQLLGRAG